MSTVDYDCEGTELELQQCRRRNANEFSSLNCETAGVICSKIFGTCNNGNTAL